MAEIFKASEAANLAIHSMAILQLESNKAKNIKEIAHIISASTNHLAKVMLKLSKAGLVKSNRGPAGGFVLNKSAADITLKEIYEAIEGRIVVSKCFFKIPSCDGKACLLGDFSERTSHLLEKMLNETKLSDIKFSL